MTRGGRGDNNNTDSTLTSIVDDQDQAGGDQRASTFAHHCDEEHR